MGNFLVYASLIVGFVLVSWAYINSNPLQSLLAYRWIGIQILALTVYAGSCLTQGSLAWFWFIQVISIILLIYTILLMAFAEVAWDGLCRKIFDILTK